MKNGLVHGFGINDADYPVTSNSLIEGKWRQVWICPFFSRWRAMISRCYSKSRISRFPSYKACTVSAEWSRFSEFRSWMDSQEWHGYELDKDILCKGNKLYSPDKCVFIEPRLNRFIIDRGSDRGDYPIGVYWHKGANKFASACRNPFHDKIEHLGYFSTAENAHIAWRERKHKLSCAYADLHKDPRIAEALRKRYLTQAGDING